MEKDFIGNNQPTPKVGGRVNQNKELNYTPDLRSRSKSPLK